MKTKQAYIIAEAGVNHNGSIEMAKRLIDVAADCGADAVKFQTFRADKIVSRGAEKAAYQKRTSGAEESQYTMIKKLELDERSHEVLLDHCRRRQIQFLSTPFDTDSLNLLADTLDLPYIKIPSGEITNAPFLLAIARTGKPVIMSTGMSTLGETEQALGILAFGYLGVDNLPGQEAFAQAYCSAEGQNIVRQKVSLLHCTTEYPAPFDEVNLQGMDTLKAAFHLSVGFSDHTPGIAAAIGAVARGASIIEKHFTLDRNLPGPDHKASLEPGELKEMVQAIRQVELAIGQGAKIPAPSEAKNKTVARKSLVAARPIKKGELFDVANLTAKRPGTGISPLYYWEWLGKAADRDYVEDEMIGV
ncbi:aldolase-type tim barrel [Lucifera butyrica]|uniref:Aldolase-type tim barrel n=1 Tax=Lucifera butyrica TaxID=1351585 RepID=A0A498R243_9FIRM|nr:N-acetylneuraminate synthase [Lucifera butyrica]VBB05534.1 aldolase-type tim barrel [Lucifera butyrica]